MYFDNLTLVSLLIFGVAFGSFIYVCIIRGCISKVSDDERQDHTASAEKKHRKKNRTTGN